MLGGQVARGFRVESNGEDVEGKMIESVVE
jgi:hypothetical protein